MSHPPTHSPRRTTLRALAVLVSIALPLGLVAAATPTSAAELPSSTNVVPAVNTTPVSARRTDNPLTGRSWGVYKGLADQAWDPYTRSSGRQRELLAKIALQPKAQWFGGWISDRKIAGKVKDYIDNAQQGDADALVQMAVFRMSPWEHEACRRLPSVAEQASYKAWIDHFASAIGDTHVALILQPDGPFALCAPGGSQLPSLLIGYATRAFSALPHTSVYIDAGAADWMRDDAHRAVKLLVPAGIALARGFALNSTHYSSTSAEIAFGTKVVNALAARGITGKHFVVNTSSNGQPFAGYTYQGPNFDNAWTCSTKTEHRCVTLGIPPTADVTDSRWGLSAKNRTRAARHVDAYLWFGRPWLNNQADPFVLKRALAVARTTPY